MTNLLTNFIVGFSVVYILMSLPAMLGLGYVIDWVPEATVLQKITGYVVEGLINNYIIKLVVSLIVGVIYSIFRLQKNK